MRTFGSAIFSAMFSRDSVLRFPMFYNSVLPDRSRCQSCAPRATPARTCRSPACLQTGIVLHHRDRHADHVGDDAVGETFPFEPDAGGPTQAMQRRPVERGDSLRRQRHLRLVEENVEVWNAPGPSVVDHATRLKEIRPRFRCAPRASPIATCGPPPPGVSSIPQRPLNQRHTRSAGACHSFPAGTRPRPIPRCRSKTRSWRHTQSRRSWRSGPPQPTDRGRRQSGAR